MPQFQRLLAFIFVFGLLTAIAPALRADTGVQIGVRGGIQLFDDEVLRHQHAPAVGAEARFGFELSPLIVALSFDHFFVEDRTLYHVGANALYDLPIDHSFLYPYVGAGLGVTRFALPEGGDDPVMVGPAMSDNTDSNGMRFGLNLAAGVRFEHAEVPVVRPFAQVMATVGPIDLLTVAGGVLFELDGG